MSNYEFFNRDLSWLSFNYRVLEEAMDLSLPLYERLKFLAIYSNNMEEFYQVRVSYYQQMLRHEKRFPKQIKYVKPAEVIHDINKIVSEQQVIFHRVYDEVIVPELKKNNIHILESNDILSDSHKDYVREVFFAEILTHIQPVLLVKQRVRPFLKTGNVYLALEMVIKDKLDKKTGKRREQYGIIKLPVDKNIPRFVQLPSENNKHFVMFLEDVIMHEIGAIFPGYDIKDFYSISKG